PEVRCGVLPAVGTGEVDEFACGERGSKPLPGLGVKQLPSRVADRGEGPQQMVDHRTLPASLPIPSEPGAPVPGLGSSGSPPEAASASDSSPCSTMSPV